MKTIHVSDCPSLDDAVIQGEKNGYATKRTTYKAIMQRGEDFVVFEEVKPERLSLTEYLNNRATSVLVERKFWEWAPEYQITLLREGIVSGSKNNRIKALEEKIIKVVTLYLDMTYGMIISATKGKDILTQNKILNETIPKHWI
jgi:hypothetical protein